MGSDPLGSLRGPPTRSTAFMSPTPARPGGAKKAPPPQPMTKLDKVPPPPQESGAEETVAVSSQHKPSPAKVSSFKNSSSYALSQTQQFKPNFLTS